MYLRLILDSHIVIRTNVHGAIRLGTGIMRAAQSLCGSFPPLPPLHTHTPSRSGNLKSKSNLLSRIKNVSRRLESPSNWFASIVPVPTPCTCLCELHKVTVNPLWRFDHYLQLFPEDLFATLAGG